MFGMVEPSQQPTEQDQPDSTLSLETITLIAAVVLLCLVAVTLSMLIADRPNWRQVADQLSTLSAGIVAGGPHTLSPTPPPIPTALPTRTFTPSATPTETVTPTPTLTRTPTPTMTWTPSKTPTITQTPLYSATPRATRVVPTPFPSPRPGYYVRLWNVRPHLKAVYQAGIALGNNPKRFSKIGDSETWSPRYLQVFEGNDYRLGEFPYLQAAIDQFRGSFARGGYSAQPGFASGAVLDPQWSDPAHCQPQETPLACEYREHKPAIALIMLRTWANEAGKDTQFYYDMCAIVEYSLKQGVIPVLSTIPYAYPPWPPAEDANETIRLVAYQYNVPLWDLWETTEGLPEHGIDRSDNHLSKPPGDLVGYLIDPYLQYGTVRRNLEALQVLYEILNGVINAP